MLLLFFLANVIFFPLIDLPLFHCVLLHVKWNKRNSDTSTLKHTGLYAFTYTKWKCVDLNDLNVISSRKESPNYTTKSIGSAAIADAVLALALTTYLL